MPNSRSARQVPKETEMDARIWGMVMGSHEYGWNELQVPDRLQRITEVASMASGLSSLYWVYQCLATWLPELYSP